MQRHRLTRDNLERLVRIYEHFDVSADVVLNDPNEALRLVLEQVEKDVKPNDACRQTVIWPAMLGATHQFQRQHER